MEYLEKSNKVSKEDGNDLFTCICGCNGWNYH